MDKVVGSAELAVADVEAGSSVAIAGFGVSHRFPSGLIRALRDQGTTGLTLVCNSPGRQGTLTAGVLIENGQVAKLIAAFSARPGTRSEAEDQMAAGTLEVELVPQGTLVERMRAGGAGIAAFFTPTAAGTTIAAGKEVRFFDGRPHVLETGLRVDYALLRAWRADPLGNLEFRGGSQNFNPSFAKAARVAIAEVDEIVEPGQLDPDRIGLPGIFVARVVQTREHVRPDAAGSAPRRAGRVYAGKPALTRHQMAAAAASLLRDGSYVNLGVGIPTLVSDHLTGRDVTLHAENGILGYGGLVAGDDADPDVYNAGGQFVSLADGASFFDSVTSFEMARSGRLDAVILGAYQVDQEGNLANWATPDMIGGGIGGAMDLVAGDAPVIVITEHCSSSGEPKLVKHCTYPVTGFGCVDTIVTDLGLFRRTDSGYELAAIAPGFSVDEVLALTDMEVSVPAMVEVIGTDG